MVIKINIHNQNNKYFKFPFFLGDAEEIKWKYFSSCVFKNLFTMIKISEKKLLRLLVKI